MARKIAADVQEAIATARYIRMSPTKARQVIDLIRGRHVDDARRVLQFTPKAASEPVGKVLESAIANAEHNRGLPGDELIVVRAWADEGPTLKRFRPRAMGRATRIRKRTCHISVVVGRSPEAVITVPATKPATEAPTKKKTTAKKTTKGTTSGGPQSEPRAKAKKPAAPKPEATETPTGTPEKNEGGEA